MDSPTTPLVQVSLETGDVDLRTGVVGTTGVRLTTRERGLLGYLAERSLADVPRGELLVAVWEYAETSNRRAVDDTMRRLRKKVERDPRAPNCESTLAARHVDALRTRFHQVFSSRRRNDAGSSRLSRPNAFVSAKLRRKTVGSTASTIVGSSAAGSRTASTASS